MVPTSIMSFRRGQRIRSGRGTPSDTPSPSSAFPLDTFLRYVGYSANLETPSESREGSVGPVAVGSWCGREPNRRAAPQSKFVTPSRASRVRGQQCGQPPSVVFMKQF